jgi:tRNA (Thr-GGU) A37 N-methylase
MEVVEARVKYMERFLEGEGALAGATHVWRSVLAHSSSGIPSSADVRVKNRTAKGTFASA